VVEHSTHNPKVNGSNLAADTNVDKLEKEKDIIGRFFNTKAIKAIKQCSE
jgi:hypothetical protein